jgi:chromosome segregation ATPase
MTTIIFSTVIVILLGALAVSVYKYVDLKEQANTLSLSLDSLTFKYDSLVSHNAELDKEIKSLSINLETSNTINRNVNERRTDFEHEIARLNAHILSFEDVINRKDKCIEDLKDKVAVLENPPVLVTSEPESVTEKPTVKKRVRVKK